MNMRLVIVLLLLSIIMIGTASADSFTTHYSDNFDDNSLNNSFFSNATTGTATLSETGGKISIVEDSLDDGGYISPKRGFDEYNISSEFNFSATTAGYTGVFIENSSIAFVPDIDPAHTKFMIVSYTTGSKIVIGAYGTADNLLTWNGTGWASGINGISASLNTKYIFQIEKNGSNYRGTVFNSTGGILNQTLWTATSLIKNGAYNDYIGLGDTLNTKSNMDFTIDNFSMGYNISANLPNLTSYYSNKSGFNISDIIMNQNRSIYFNVTANQSIMTYNWYVNGTNQNNNYDNFTFNQSSGNYSVQANATSINGTSNTIIWNISKGFALNNTNVSIQYRYLTDKVRNISEVATIFNETNASYINLGIARSANIPNTCADLPVDEQAACHLNENSYAYFQIGINAIKGNNSDVLIGGAVSSEFLNPVTRNEMTMTTNDIPRATTWTMALDPSKWGIGMNKTTAQIAICNTHGWTCVDPENDMPYFFPDHTNTSFQTLWLSWIDRQISVGIDVMLIDFITKQSQLLEGISSQTNDSVRDMYANDSYLIDEIHRRGLATGKYVYVMSWTTATDLVSPYPALDLDGVMTTPGSEEIVNMTMNETKWDDYVTAIRARYGNIPIFAMFDQGASSETDYRPLEAFSQNLTSLQQKQFLMIADAFYKSKGIKFIYPVHGGVMGSTPAVKSFGLLNWYDSIAPEFDTYCTIEALATGGNANLCILPTGDYNLSQINASVNINGGCIVTNITYIEPETQTEYTYTCADGSGQENASASVESGEGVWMYSTEPMDITRVW